MSILKQRNEYRDNVVFEGGSYPVPSSDRTFGLVVNENFAGLSSIPSTYIDTGCSPSFDGVKMSIGLLTANGQVGNRIEYNYYQNFESFYMEVVIRLNYSEASGKTGVTIGVLKRATGSNSFGNRSVGVWYRTDTNASTRRRIRLVTGTNATNYTTWNMQSQGNQIMTFASGDIIKLTLKKSIGTIGSIYYTTIQNITSGIYSDCSWEESLSAMAGDAYGNAVSRPFISTYTGEIDIVSWKFRGDDETNRELLILGDSISHGLLATSSDKVWFKDFNNCAAATGPNNTTQDILDMISNAIAYKPRRVLLFLGTNDVANGVAQATREANYVSIVEQLESEGIEVIVCTALPRTSANNIFLNWNPFIRSMAGKKGLKLIDFFSLAVGRGSGTDASNTSLFPDGIHPSDLMHSYMRDLAKEVLGRTI